MTVVGVLLNLQRYVIPVWLPMMVAAGRLPYGALAAGLAGWILWTYVGTRVGPGRLRSVLLAAAFSLTLASCLALRETFPWSSISLVIAVYVSGLDDLAYPVHAAGAALLGMVLVGCLVEVHVLAPLLVLAAIAVTARLSLPSIRRRGAPVAQGERAAPALEWSTLVAALVHNGHYYLYSFLIPLAAYSLSRNGLTAAALFVAGWLAYLLDREILDSLSFLASPRAIGAAGFVGSGGMKQGRRARHAPRPRVSRTSSRRWNRRTSCPRFP